MSAELVLLTALLVLLIVVAFGFTGCGGEPFESGPDDRREPTPEGTKYADIVKGTDGFVAHWPLNETSGATALVDGPPALNGIYMPGAVPGSPGAFAAKEPGANFAPSLDGSTGYVEVPFSVLLNTAANLSFSLEVWVKPAASLDAGTEQIVISSHHISTAGNHRGYEIALLGTAEPHATVAGRVFYTTAAPFVAAVSLTPTDGDPLAWRHIVLTYNGSGADGVLRIYVSVEGVAGSPFSENTAAPYQEVQAGGQGERPLRFGAGHLQEGGPEKFFEGLIDEVAFYDGALGTTDIELHFQAL